MFLKLLDDSAVDERIQVVKRFRPTGATPEEVWKRMCQLVQTDIHEDVAGIWTRADGTGEEKLTRAFAKFRKNSGKVTNSTAALREVLNFKRREDEAAVRTIARFNSLVQTYEEEHETPYSRDGDNIKRALLEGVGLLIHMSDYPAKLSDTCEKARVLLRDMDTDRARIDRLDAARMKRDARGVHGIERETRRSNRNDTHRDCRSY